MMEELQDAIEDAQYMNAISTQLDGPRPMEAWTIPTETELEEWLQRSEDKHVANLEKTLESAIGLFLFSSFLKEICEDFHRINFCEAVIRWKTNPKRDSTSHRVEKAKKIIAHYLQQPKQFDPQTGQPVYPRQTEIDELDLARLPNRHLHLASHLVKQGNANNSDSHNSDAESSRIMDLKEFRQKLFDENWDGTYKKCCVGLDGPVRDQIFETIHRVEHARAQYRKEREEQKKLLQMAEKDERQKQQQQQQLLKEQHANGVAAVVEKEKVGDSKNEEKNGAKKAEPKESAARSDNDGPVQEESKQPDNNKESKAAEETVTSVVSTPKPVSTSSRSSSKTKPSSYKSSSSKSAEHRNSSRVFLRHKTGPRYLPDDFFDAAESVVMQSLDREYWDAFKESKQYRKLLNFLWYQDRTVTFEDFYVMRVLGRGGFGSVTACKKATSGKLYAMKVMSKRRIKLKKAEQLTLNERAALAAVESPFVVNLKYSFHNKEDVFLVLDLMTGGDLGYHLKGKLRFPRKESMYYSARIMLGLQALHDKGYVYRDLKPENCLLADDGRVKITDLGLATKITPNLHGAAGTRGYWAPEMLRRDSRGKRMTYGHTVDWFSFGCCLAEFICGQNPFRTDAAIQFGQERGHETKDKAYDCATLEMNPEFDRQYFDKDAADLCRKLLDKDERRRIGYGGCEEIMVHPWFKDLSWQAIITDRQVPPFEPAKDVNAASQSEIGVFSEDKAFHETVLDEKDARVWEKWNWTNPRAFAAEVIEFLIYERETGVPLVPQPPHSSCCCAVS